MTIPSKSARHVGASFALVALAGCGLGSDRHEPGETKSDVVKQEGRPTSATPAATTSNILWKRYAAFEADLARALELPAGELCLEFGTEPCIRKVHLVPLGGNEPFATGMLEAASEPMATTPTVVDRIVLTACSNRIARDLAAGKDGKVFTAFPLGALAPASEHPSARALVADLYRRLLSRDALEEEIDLVVELARDAYGEAVSAVEFAKLACYAIGSSAEFLFF